MNSLIFGAAGLVAAGLSARWNWWRMPVAGYPVLMYHKVGNPPAGPTLHKLWVSTDMFRKQMTYLKRNGYTPVIFKDLYNFLDKSTALPKKPVFITFDDGYENNFKDAFPILQEFGFPATLFVVVDTIGGDNKWHNPASEARIKMVTWDQVKQLRDAGWEIGSHTMSHRNLQTIDLKEVKMEVEKSRQALTEVLGEVPETFAYPYGSGEDNLSVIQKVREAGYRIAVGVHTGVWPVSRFKEQPFQLPRIFVRGDETMFDFHLEITRGRSRF